MQTKQTNKKQHFRHEFSQVELCDDSIKLYTKNDRETSLISNIYETKIKTNKKN